MIGLENRIPEEEPFKYSEYRVKNFTSAVEEILDYADFDNGSSDEGYGDKNICIIDIDGSLIENNLVKLPFLSKVVKPEVSSSSLTALQKLSRSFNGSVIISTNRSKNEHRIFNSKEVLRVTREAAEKSGESIPIFTDQFKQIPGKTKENVALKGLYIEEGLSEKVLRPKTDSLIHYIGKRVTEKDIYKITIFCIEDWSIVSLNRESYLRYIAKELKGEYGIDSKVVNFVIEGSIL